MRYSPSVDSKPPPIWLRPGPLHGHVSRALYPLPQVIKAVVQMIAAILPYEPVQHSLLVVGVVLFDGIKQRPGV